tara:strand:+ start:285 stop:908 length:624 start_codon:yes stop_codon:yes gene_type:complete
MKDSFIVYRSFHLAISELDDKDRLMIYDAIFEFGLNHKEIKLEQLPKAMWHLIKPQLEANHRKYLNGKLGGQANKKNWANKEQSNSKAIANDKQKDSKAVANVNVNANVNENVNCKVELPLKSGEVVMLDNQYMDEISLAYPLININDELRKMRTWLISNPDKQKTARGTPRFVSSWLSRVDSKPPEPTDSYASIHKAVMDRKNVRK